MLDNISEGVAPLAYFLRQKSPWRSINTISRIKGKEHFDNEKLKLFELAVKHILLNTETFNDLIKQILGVNSTTCEAFYFENPTTNIRDEYYSPGFANLNEFEKFINEPGDMHHNEADLFTRNIDFSNPEMHVTDQEAKDMKIKQLNDKIDS